MYKRVLLKLSGEALSSPGNSFDPAILRSLAQELKEIHDLGIDLAIVVGGGNFIRGKMIEQMGVDRVQGDYMGMLGTVINALAVQNALEKIGVPTRVINADVILMAKNGVDGVYNADPKTHPEATKYDNLTYMDLIQEGLQVMDTTATSMCMDNDIDLVVFNMNEKGNIIKAVRGEITGTVISKDGK